MSAEPESEQNNCGNLLDHAVANVRAVCKMICAQSGMG